MSHSVIHEIRAKNYGCLKEVAIPLTPMHAFIGPNDSGKSTILRAVRTVTQLLAFRFEIERGPNAPFDTGISNHQRKDFQIEAVLFSGGPTIMYRFQGLHSFTEESLFIDSRLHQSGHRNWGELSGVPLPGVLPKNLQSVIKPIKKPRLIRLDPDMVRRPSHLLLESQTLDFSDERGYGLAGILDTVLNRGDDSFSNIVNQIRDLFPTVKHLGLRVVSGDTKEIEVELTSGERVRAPLLSEGLLYYMAFAALPYLEPSSLLLIEEPENGLHPARIADVIKVLRKISEHTQVLIATHSPLVINELRPEEVTVVTRTEEMGTVTTPIMDTPHFETRSKVYALGELWLSYANGEDEAPLLTGIQE